MIYKRTLWLAIPLLIFGIITFYRVKANVELVSFTASEQEGNILIRWETATELDNAGFYVTRSTNPAPIPYDPISNFIPAEGSGVIGSVYQFLDDDVTTDQAYYYILEAIDVNQTIERHGPISFTLGIQPTDTPVITSTPSRTPTPTRTKTPTTGPSRTPTRTRVVSNTPTNTPIDTPTQTATETPLPTFTPSNTPSPTLMDAPIINIIVPPDNTPIPIPDLVMPLPSQTQKPTGVLEILNESANLGMISAICLTILIWMAIAVGIFIIIQRRVL